MKVQDEALTELEAIFTEKYLSKLDRCVPFYDMTYTMAKLANARLRFKLHHPRGRAANAEGDVYITKEESDVIFNAALSFVELVEAGFKSKFCSHIFTHLTATFQIGAIELAWALVDGLYTEHPELIEHVENSLFFALGNLTLEAWEARRKVLEEGETTPTCIELLWSKRRVTSGDTGMPIQGITGLEGWEFNVGENFDVNYWNDFMRF
ncbi:transcription factor [Fusarium heterosporum]|uniref:Transcription factor n=1 Tax=Fusarium heterosporum TaxID=42747 RepID=A0A8H5SNX2_FUSHE|nr:transcription factor [Fusarium heterosporum]